MSEETTALATTSPFDQNAALAALGYSATDVMKPSKLALVQPIEVDEENGKVAGTFMDVKSKQKFKKMRIVPLYIGGDDPGSLNGRVCFGSQELGSKPICRSRNGRLPVISDDIVRQDGGLGCAKCPKAQWKKIGGKSIRPQCNETIKFLFADEETGFPYLVNVKGVNLPPIKDLRDTLRKEIVMRAVKASKGVGTAVPLYGFVVEMNALKIEGKKGRYYIFNFSAPEALEDPTQFGPIFTSLVTNRGVDLNDDTEGDAEPTGDQAVSGVIDAEYVEA